MPKIAFVGAGSEVFTRNLCSDILLSPALQGSTLSPMDIDARRLKNARAAVEAIVRHRGLSARVEATTDRREALRGADYVITTFQQGGVAAYEHDVRIPLRYGVGQCVGDTLVPGGVFRALCTIPVLLEICHQLDELAPDALLLNYVNPIAANCWAVDRLSGRPHVGLCHSVHDTSAMLARWLEVPYDEIRFVCAGINHQAFYLSFRHGDENLYPRLREAVERPDLLGREPVRIDLFKSFGYFVTEASGHASEYVPYFRKSAAQIEEELAPRFTNRDHSGWYDMGRSGGYLRGCLWWVNHHEKAFQKLVSGETPIPTERSHEYGARIIEAIETDTPTRINGTLPGPARRPQPHQRQCAGANRRGRRHRQPRRGAPRCAARPAHRRRLHPAPDPRYGGRADCGARALAAAVTLDAGGDDQVSCNPTARLSALP